MFVDKQDTPRIPRDLFDNVCEINVPGSAGPVYRSLLQATYKFLLIVFFLLFIFIVVLSFSNVYKISGTNQMLATMAGGFLPFLLRTVMSPSNKVNLELSSVSFKGKLDEIIQNFKQSWPMADFPFEIIYEDQDATYDVTDDIITSQNEAEPHTSLLSNHSPFQLVESNNNEINIDVRPYIDRLNPPRGQRIPLQPMSDGSSLSGRKWSGFKPAKGQTVDIMIILPDKTHPKWCPRWSDLHLYTRAPPMSIHQHRRARIEQYNSEQHHAMQNGNCVRTDDSNV